MVKLQNICIFVKKTQMTSNDEFILKRISSSIKSKDPNAEVILFGSHARGTARSESDWDILILVNTNYLNKTTVQI